MNRESTRETQRLLNEISAFCNRHGIGYNTFGVTAMKDPRFVYDLKDGGRNPAPRTVQKLEAFMLEADMRAAAETAGLLT